MPSLIDIFSKQQSHVNRVFTFQIKTDLFVEIKLLPIVTSWKLFLTCFLRAYTKLNVKVLALLKTKFGSAYRLFGDFFLFFTVTEMSNRKFSLKFFLILTFASVFLLHSKSAWDGKNEQKRKQIDKIENIILILILKFEEEVRGRSLIT